MKIEKQPLAVIPHLFKRAERSTWLDYCKGETLE